MSKSYKDSNQIIGALFHILDVGLNKVDLDFVRLNALNYEGWDRLFSLANYHEVAPLLSDVISNSTTTITIPIDVRLKFLGMQEVVERSGNYYMSGLSDLLAFFNLHDIPTMIVKGISLAQYYPNPSHRKCGDLDIYQFGQQQWADKLISQSFGIEIKNSIVGHHTNYQYKNIRVENHYHFITTYYGGESLELEALLEKEAIDSVRSEIGQQHFFSPPPTLNAIFLPYHMAGHFREERVSMRQIIDWMMFLKTEYENVDWKWVNDIYEKYHLSIFVNAINGILVHYLKMPEKYAYHYIRNEKVEARIYKDLMGIKENKSNGFGDDIKHEWKQYIESGWKFRLFGKYGSFELGKKVWNYVKCRENFKERIVYRADLTK